MLFFAFSLEKQRNMTYEELLKENEKLRIENQTLKSIDKDDFFSLSADFLCTFFHRRFLQVNPAFVNALGYSKEYILAHSLHEFLHPEDREKTNKIILDYIHKEGKLTIENRYLCENGVYMRISWQLYVKKNGVAYAVGRDVTQKRILEEAIKNSEQLLKSIFNSNSYLFIVFDKDNKIVKVNENAKRAAHFLFGKDLAKLNNIFDLFPSDLHAIMNARIMAILQGETIKYEQKLKHRFSSDELWYQVSMTPLYSDRDVVGICYAANDISVHKQSEQKIQNLLESEKRLSEELRCQNEDLWQNIEEMRTMEEFLKLSETIAKKAEKEAVLHKDRLEHIFNNLDQHFFWVIDAKTREMILLSQGFEKILGYATKEIGSVEEAVQDIVYKEDVPKLKMSYEAFLQGNDGQTVEFRCLSATGELKWLSSQAKLYRGINGQIERIEGIVTDITESKYAEMALKKNILELQKTQKDLEYKNQELDNFVYRASHDLRGPIASMLGLCNLLQREQYDSQTNEYHELLDQRTRRLDEILKELTNLMKIKDAVVEVKTIDLHHIIQQVKLNLTDLQNFQTIRWDISIEVSKPIVSDENLLQIIIQNLVENAINFARLSRNQPYVRIQITENEEDTNILQIIVSDNGQGILKEAVPKIFNIFFRASEESRGSGLGLYILKNALDKLQGEVRVETVLGAGTTFILQIPTN